MNDKELTKKSKKLSYILRHDPKSASLVLDNAGWVSTSKLLTATAMTSEELDWVVANNNKKRFEFNADKTQIRASQGHSVEVDLEYEPTKPPDVLYHGTAVHFYDNIMLYGLKKMDRHHVHLSIDIKTAKTVGSRKGTPIVLEINAKQMYEQGKDFYLSTNGVWLTDYIPSINIKKISI